jgi:hypothetical protein
MSSKSRSASKSKKKTSQPIALYEDEEKIDQIIKDITLKRPRNAYTQFVLSQSDQIKSKNKDSKIKIADLSANCAEKWKKMSKEEKKKYVKLYEEEKQKYKNDLELVRHYLFKDYQDTVHRAPTAYQIFVSEKLRLGFEQNLDPKDIKKAAATEWSQMTEEQKGVYKDKKKQNDSWFEKAKKIRKITPIALFIQKKYDEAKETKKDPPKLADIAPLWKKLSKKEKQTYEKYAQELNEEKEHLQDLYEITHGVKPKRPNGAFRIFLQEKAKNNEIKSLTQGQELWKKLTEEQKEEYLKKSHRCQLAYKYKKMIYVKQIKKILPKRPGNAYTQFLKEKKGQKIPEGQNFLKYWRPIYEKLTPEEKAKYEEKAKKAKEIYDKKFEQFANKVFDMPKKPLSGFTFYVAEKMPLLKKEKPDLLLNDLSKQIAEEWQKEPEEKKAEYIKKSEEDKKRFKRQFREFKKKGYYSNNPDGDVDEEDEKEEKKSSKKKSGSKMSSKKSRKSASKKKDNDKKKSSKSKSKNKSKKKSQKDGKSQRKSKSKSKKK